MSASIEISVPSRVGVMGGGRMGGGIAHAFILAGAYVVVVERDVESAEAAKLRIEASIDASVARGFNGDAALLKQALTVATDVGAFGACQLVVEAVPEILDLKLETLRAIEQQLPDFATLASNTSSIPLAQLAETLDRPEQFIGLHFFNPVPASTLIEIVVHEQVSETLAEKARGWVRALDKTPITVSDSPGFASSRLGVAIALEAMRMVEEGVASTADIDLAMELGYKHPSGPLKTTDIVGLDVRLGIAEQLERDLGPRFAPPQLLRDMVAEGKLGRKSGQGFYDWTNGE
ncbi:MAG: 3-hydroxyacyl-CoA dehydrogenase family protein [Actinobacteria bacterium]|jgi:3-hydroxybutyryl-CoA dehydrogenase|nr:3-hydroxyacyl-CoA dehydrogenase family protein [Actinomycetota bacterium]